MREKIFAKLVFWPTYFWNLLNVKVRKIWNWWDRIDDHVIVGALPHRFDVKGMVADGVTGVVNTCEEYEGPLAEYEEAKIEQFRMPTIDFTHPKLEDVEAAVSFIEKHAAKNGTVYVHCKAGRARSATVAICWLIHQHRMAPDKALEKLISCRKQTLRKILKRPVVKQFAKIRGFEIPERV